MFRKDSLQALRSRVNLVEALTPYVELRPAGASYKALCPFHDEKSPSFTVQKGDSHYHCFGCGAHGDAIQFLMAHQKLGFLEAVESLAERFGVALERVDRSEEKKGPSKSVLKEALEYACKFYHLMLLHSNEGRPVLEYLYRRGIDLDFIRHFEIGFSIPRQGMLRKTLEAKFVKDEVMAEAGLLHHGQNSRYREFFFDRIMFPIRDAAGSCIGFSARKYKEETFGGKYINTPETPLFKKSKVLFGLNYSRRQIAKQRKALIVEGQIDALKLIQQGFNFTVAGQGTAFGEGHVKELMALGISDVFLALDSDEAGRNAAFKIGNLFQKEGVGVKVVLLPQGKDPDAFLKERGAEEFLNLLEQSIDYLDFAVKQQSALVDIRSPAGKNQLAGELGRQIRGWNHPLMIHEGLRKLAHLIQVPEDVVGVGAIHTPNLYIKKSASIGIQTVDPDKIIEEDVLRWLLLMGASDESYILLVKRNLSASDFHHASCRSIYETYLALYEKNALKDLLSVMAEIDDADASQTLAELLQKRLNKDKAKQHYTEAIQKVLSRNWMEKREAIKMRIQSAECSDEAVLELVKQFDDLKKHPPKVQVL